MRNEYGILLDHNGYIPSIMQDDSSYDTTQHERNRGKSYANCEVCERWKVLSCFAKDIKKLDGYGEWATKTGYCLDKDIKNPGNKVYSKENCCFVPYTENIREISKRKPGNIQKLHEAKKVCYMLQRDGETMLFNSEKDACEYLGVRRCRMRTELVLSNTCIHTLPIKHRRISLVISSL